MWIIRRHRPSSRYIILFLVVLLIYYSYLTFYQKKIFETSKIKISNLTNSSDVYLHIELDLTKTTAVCQTDDYLIIYILSTVTNIERRRVIRSTWASKQNRVCFVFILGQIPNHINNPNEIQMKINNEKKEYYDIIQINHTESYANVVYKEIGALKWSQYFYPNIPYLFKTDDDLIVDTILISSIAHLLLTNISTNNSVISKYRPILISTLQSASREKFFRGGWAMDYQPAVRDTGKFGVSMDVWPHPVLPAYCSGFGWIMSKNIRDRLVNASYTYPLNKTAWIGDVFVSGFLAKAADVQCSGISIDFEQTSSANCSCSMVNNPMLTVCSSTFHAGGGGTEIQKYIEYQKAWKVIQLRHNMTNTVINDC